MSAEIQPTIRKAFRVTGKTLSFRDAQVQDAAFILSLRTDREKSKHLSSVSDNLDAQRAWLERCSEDASQAYFIIEHDAHPIGTVRLYDPQGSNFCWGSWILVGGCPSHAAIESALMVYAYGQDYLGFTEAHFDVRKSNHRVWRFHERFGAIRVNENHEDYFYRLDQSAMSKSRKRYRRFLENSVKVDFL